MAVDEFVGAAFGGAVHFDVARGDEGLNDVAVTEGAPFDAGAGFGDFDVVTFFVFGGVGEGDGDGVFGGEEAAVFDVAAEFAEAVVAGGLDLFVDFALGSET